MDQFQFGPSSLSTLYFIPDYIKQHTQPKETEEIKSESLCSKDVIQKQPLPNRKSVSDYETVAFVGLRGIIKINDDKLAKLYNYNKREYATFIAVITNLNINYNNLINPKSFTILYRFFSRIANKDLWNDICEDLGFTNYFTRSHISDLYDKVRNLEIRAKHTQQSSELRFFIQLMVYYWSNTNTINIADNFTYFWTQCIAQIIQFILDIAVNRNIEIYCLSTKKWIKANIVKVNESEYQLYAQFLDGSNIHQWFTFFSPQLAPIGFKYFYIPNMTKRNNVPCIVSVVNDQLDTYAQKHVEIRNTESKQVQTIYDNRHTNEQSDVIPVEDWYYKSNNNKVGPVLIRKLFMGCVEKVIDLDTPLYHSKYGFTTLNKLPHIVNAFREHVQKCKTNLEIIMSRQHTRQPTRSMTLTGQREELFTSSTNSSIDPNSYTTNAFGMNFNDDSNHSNQ